MLWQDLKGATEGRGGGEQGGEGRRARGGEGCRGGMIRRTKAKKKREEGQANHQNIKLTHPHSPPNRHQFRNHHLRVSPRMIQFEFECTNPKSHSRQAATIQCARQRTWI